MTLPKALKKGDTIGIISPSSAVTSFCPLRLQRGVDELKKLGFEVKIGKHATKKFKHTAGTIEERIEDLHTMFSDEDIQAIFCTIGGLNSHQLLDYIDYDLIATNPKIFMGYSDITALLNAITKKTELITYLGPAVLPQFGEFGGILEYSWDFADKILIHPETSVEVTASNEWTDEMLWWDKEDDRPRKTSPNTGMKVLQHGEASGQLWGGNAGTLLLLAGTPYMPNLDGAILCLEEDEDESPGTIDRYFTQLRHIGVYEKISGMLIGRFHSKAGLSPEDNIEDIVSTAVRGYDFPIIYDMDFGHTDPMITIPIGGSCTVSTEPLHISFSQ